MSFRLIDTHWNEQIIGAFQHDPSALRIVCPFIKMRAIERLLAKRFPETLHVITRFNLNDFAAGVSDFTALRMLLKCGASIRGVKNLHAKLYLFGNSQAIVTSANLTLAAMDRNLEFGFLADDATILDPCRKYFDDLWARARYDLTHSKLTEWEQMVTEYIASGACFTSQTILPDEGSNTGIPTDSTEIPPAFNEASQAFVKFFGTSSDRSERSVSVFDEVVRSGCHWACTYPKGKRPRQVQDGATMFMGRLVKDPNDILIYGCAVGLSHQIGRDDATEADIRKRGWKKIWPHYVRVHHPEFIAGDLNNGISLNELMDALGPNAYRVTQEHDKRGEGNTDPRRAYMQQPAVELSVQAINWLNKRLQHAFEQNGKLTRRQLSALDWPEIPFAIPEKR